MTAQFGYLLNAMERAACEHNPAAYDYKGKRIAVLGYVSALEAERDRLAAELAECRGQLNRVVDMNKRYQRMVNEASPYMVCENMHHDKRDRHGLDEDCPVATRWHIGIDDALAAEGESQ